MEENIRLQIDKIRRDCDNLKPLVVIRCLVYNHEPYIKDALEGFVMQKTDFSFVAIIHDDASTDNTANIIRDYAEKYPNIIKPIYEVENQYSKHDGSLGKIINTACKNTGAKYVAICEGDDYWIDPLKLQKQINYLESNPEYSMCFHNALEKWEFGDKPDKLFSNIQDREYHGVEMFKDWIVPTASTVFRTTILFSSFYTTIIRNPKFIFGDSILFCSCAKFGKIRGMTDVMSVYRRNLTSITNISHSEQFTLKAIEFHEEFGRVFGGEYGKAANNKYVKSFGSLGIHAFVRGQIKKAFKYLLIANRRSTIGLLKYLLGLPLSQIAKIGKNR